MISPSFFLLELKFFMCEIKKKEKGKNGVLVRCKRIGKVQLLLSLFLCKKKKRKIENSARKMMKGVTKLFCLFL